MRKADPLARAVAAYAVDQGLLHRGDRVLVAVSGGADSLALLHILWASREDLELDGLAVASLDHGLRGPEGAADLAFVRDVAGSLGLPFHGGRLAPGTLEAEAGISLEDAARRARYAFLGKTACAWGPGPAGAACVATGHTADDQAETVLMRIIEGTGLRGLGGMAPRREEDGWVLVRPLLGASRGEIRDYCLRNGLCPREDVTNEDPRFRRNFVRNRVLPVMRECNPQVVQALTRLADLARSGTAGSGLSRVEAGRLPAGESPFAGLGQPVGPILHLPRAEFASGGGEAGVPLVRAAVAELAGDEVLRDLGYEGARRAARAAATLQVGARLDLPGRVVMENGYGHVFFGRFPGGKAATGASRRSVVPIALRAPGVTAVPELGWVFEVGPAGSTEAGKKASVDLDPARVVPPLAVRTRRRGDVFHPSGLGPSGAGQPKKLKDYFISMKIPRGERDGWPLLVDAEDRILWVVGLRADERFVAGAGVAPGAALRVWAERVAEPGAVPGAGHGAVLGAGPEETVF